MGAEYTAGIITFIPTIVVEHPRLGRVRMNLASHDEATCGPIIEGPSTLLMQPCVSNPPLKNPHVDDEGRRIADQSSPMHRA